MAEATAQWQSSCPHGGSPWSNRWASSKSSNLSPLMTFGELATHHGLNRFLADFWKGLDDNTDEGHQFSCLSAHAERSKRSPTVGRPRQVLEPPSPQKLCFIFSPFTLHCTAWSATYHPCPTGPSVVSACSRIMGGGGQPTNPLVKSYLRLLLFLTT